MTKEVAIIDSQSIKTVMGFAASLGVGVDSLTMLGAQRNGNAWHFPEYNGDGERIGTAIRPDRGKKHMVNGSKRGLTMAWPIGAYAGTSVDDPILVVEGQSDAATGLTLGFTTIGRPSATGGLQYLRRVVKGRHVLIIGENDGGAGRTGAEKIADGLAEVAASVRVIFPPDGCKDLREWHNAPAGCDRDEILSAAAGIDPVVSPDADETPNDTPIDLSADDPLRTARALMTEYYSHAAGPTLWSHQQTFYVWRGPVWKEMKADAMRAGIYRFVEPSFRPNRARVDNVVDALRAESNLHSTYEAPCWLSDDPDLPDPTGLVACGNGLLHLPTRMLFNPTPAYFNHSASSVLYDPDAPTPTRWRAFLDELWPDDPQAIETLQEVFGYLLTPDTRQQKLFGIIGPKRSGKGTIARVLTAVCGDGNVVGPTLASMSENFGLAPLIGNSLAVIADARLGGRTDQATIAERLLALSGEDRLTVPRKFLPDWTGRLNIRFLILSNEIPRVLDPSGAFASRFVLLVLRQSFYGREDTSLTDKLMTELPGIFNWSIEGWHRLRERGHFVTPDSSAEAVEELTDLSSPVGAFVRDRCIVGPGQRVTCARLYEAWRAWCAEQGRDHTGTVQTFGRDLRAVVPGLTVRQSRAEGMARSWEGIDLTEDIPF